MRESAVDPAIAYAVALLSHYKFELRGYTAQELVNLWLRNYQASWVRLGVIEALYQGRYKAVSVEQILAVWGRRGQPIYRFTHEFERLISRKLPQSLTARFNSAAIDLSQEFSLPPVTSSFQDMIDESVMLEPTVENPAPIEEQDTPPTDTIIPQEEMEIPDLLDDPSEELTTMGFNPAYDADWSRCEPLKQPIHQFTPPPDASGFFLKLKAVVQQQEEVPAKVSTPLVDEPESELSQPDSEKN